MLLMDGQEKLSDKFFLFSLSLIIYTGCFEYDF
jgi:hypothetical protein